MVVTRENIRDEVRQRLNYEHNTNIKDAELNSYINKSAARLYALIIQSNEDFYTQRIMFTIPGSEAPEDGYTLPQDVWRIVRVDRSLDFSNNFFALNLINIRDENAFNPTMGLNCPSVFGYHSETNMDGYTVLRVFPQESKSGYYRLLYNPAFEDYTDDDDPVNLGPPGQHWEEYVILDVCIKVCLKTEQDPSGFMASRQLIEGQIKAEGAAREAGQNTPISVVGPAWYDRGGSSGRGWY